MGHPYISADHLPAPSNEYVAWMDVMGIQAIMSRSLPISANFVLKLHVAALEALQQHVTLYPVMDGVYVTSQNQAAFKDFLRDVFVRIGTLLVATNDDRHRFLVRAGVAFGPVIHGSSLNQLVSTTLHNNPDYRDSILLGMPMVQAHLGESKAPPFGIYVHESARAFAPGGARPFNEVWWRWFEPQQHALAVDLHVALVQYFDWCAARAQAIEYAADRIAEHRLRMEQYLP